MNVAQALKQLFPTLNPELHILEAKPAAAPVDAYFIISELTDGERKTYYADRAGHSVQVRSLTLLVTLYGKEGWKLADLRPMFQTVRASLADLVTEHPSLPPLAGVERGAVLPPTPDPVGRRPFAGIRLHLTYRE